MKFKIKLLGYALTLFLSLMMNKSANASHVVGYDIALVNVKDGSGNPTDNYILRLKFFRDVTGIGIPPSFSFTMRANGGSQPIVGGQIVVTKKNPQTFLTYPPEDCPPAQAQLSVEYGFYESAPFSGANLTNAAGYYVYCEHNARNPGVRNVQGNSDSYSVLMLMDFPRLNTTSPYRYNSSPEFKKNPLTFFCVGKPYTLNWQIEDPDGDSLVFSLSQPIDDGTSKPFNLIPYAAGYNLNYNILDGVPDLTINPKTGIINFIPTQTGKYLVGFKVEEYRNGIKIGEIRREYQLETVLCPEAPPVTEDQNSQKRSITDTINFGEEFNAIFTSRDSPTDSLFMFILPNISPGENLLDPNTYEAKWGEVGSLVGGSSAQNLIIEDMGIVRGEFKWKPKCAHVRDRPYTFTVVVRDKTCPSPFYDSTFVTLYVNKQENKAPYFILPDTIKSKDAGETVLRYFLFAGDTLQFAQDSILKTYDADSAQTVAITWIPDLNNGAAVNNRMSFSDYPSQIHSTGIFRYTSICDDQRDEPYKVEFIATDDDCKSPLRARFTIEIYIIDRPNRKPEFAGNQINRFSIAEGTTDSFQIVIYDSVFSRSLNQYKNITLVPDITDFTNVNGGAIPTLSTLTANDSLKVTFKWSPVCANVRTQPYLLKLKTHDEGCPRLETFLDIEVFATGPYNSAPEFRNKVDAKFNKVDTSIYGGEELIYNLYAVDTNIRFDSVYIVLDPGSDIANSSVVEYIAELVPASGKDSARAVLRWRTDCLDIRSAPYVAYVVAYDNECVNPEKDTLVFNISVLERPNYVPRFTASTIDSLNKYNNVTYPATTLIEIPLSSYDTLTGEIIMIDTAFTTIPNGLPKPEIVKVSGIGKDTVSTVLRWYLDCSLINTNPYIIRLATWDEACRNPQDSGTFDLRIIVDRNPLLNPVFNIANDTLIEVVAGENFELELISSSVNPGDSIKIVTQGDVYGGIPGEVATFEQTVFQGEGKAYFRWTTGCDQISENIYTAKFVTANYPCQSDADTLTLTFKVVPNTDVTNEIPNVFSPNGDGKNDTYSIIKQYKVYCDPGFKFSIFNRWGKKVFESTNPAFEWDPKSSQPAGTYFFTLESRARTQTGTIEIVK